MLLLKYISHLTPMCLHCYSEVAVKFLQCYNKIVIQGGRKLHKIEVFRRVERVEDIFVFLNNLSSLHK